MTSWEHYTWAEVSDGLRHLHRNGCAVAERAEAAGKRPGDVTLIQLASAPANVLPILPFADGSQVGMEGERGL